MTDSGKSIFEVWNLIPSSSPCQWGPVEEFSCFQIVLKDLHRYQILRNINDKHEDGDHVIYNFN